MEGIEYTTPNAIQSLTSIAARNGRERFTETEAKDILIRFSAAHRDSVFLREYHQGTQEMFADSEQYVELISSLLQEFQDFTPGFTSRILEETFDLYQQAQEEAIIRHNVGEKEYVEIDWEDVKGRARLEALLLEQSLIPSSSEIMTQPPNRRIEYFESVLERAIRKGVRKATQLEDEELPDALVEPTISAYAKLIYSPRTETVDTEIKAFEYEIDTFASAIRKAYMLTNGLENQELAKLLTKLLKKAKDRGAEHTLKSVSAVNSIEELYHNFGSKLAEVPVHITWNRTIIVK